MGSKKKNKIQTGKEQPFQPYNCSVTARNLPKSELGAVIFGCKAHTIEECLSKLIFGLPFGHFAYVKKISPGLPLFLFNYSDRKLLGTFEAASPGKLNIDAYAWTNGNGYETEFPAQVKIKAFNRCYTLKESQFSSIIPDNYYDPDQPNFFWFEMDHSQTAKMVGLFASSGVPYAGRHYAHQNPTKETRSYIPQNKCNPSVPNDCVEQHSASTSYAVQSNARASSEQRSWRSLFNNTTSDTINKFEVLKIASSRPTSPLSEQYNGEWESCTSPSITRSEDHECCPEEIDEDADIQPQYEAPGICHGEWDAEVERDTENIQPFVESAEYSIQPQYEAPGIYHGEWDAEVERDTENIQPFVESPEYSVDGSTSMELKNICVAEEEEGNEDDRNQQFVEAPAYSADRNSSMDQLLISQGSSDILSMLMQEVAELKERQMKQEEKIWTLEKELAQSREVVQKLQSQHRALEAPPLPSSQQFEGFYRGTLNPSTKRGDCVLVVGEFDAVLNSEVYLLGGMHGEVWYDTVEAYNPKTNEWSKRPSLNCEKGSLAGASLYSKIFAVGGRNGRECYSEVEMLDLNTGKWMYSTSMLEKRFSTAAAEVKGALYVVGGYDGNAYLNIEDLLKGLIQESILGEK
ncbi:unnamed protein product [Cuscuta campestris]|uniref:DCD domain-containing protein n=1 Tax=Cuscuta campestris TaxID=132261 RepID=A0A484MNP5_9ASTE|nr:unnamed protein product [Cuscuta campestris]